jgi:hypothetical protein
LLLFVAFLTCEFFVRYLNLRSSLLISGFWYCDAACSSTGTSQAFRHTFALPIDASRAKDCSPADKRLGDARAKELTRLISGMVDDPTIHIHI